jgi:hypothetical protein
MQREFHVQKGKFPFWKITKQLVKRRVNRVKPKREEVVVERPMDGRRVREGRAVPGLWLQR